MTTLEKRLLGEMVKAIEEKNEKEIQYMIAKKKVDELQASYLSYKNSDKNIVEIYCGDEDRADFLIKSLEDLGVSAEYETFTVDGEYHVEVRI